MSKDLKKRNIEPVEVVLNLSKETRKKIGQVAVFKSVPSPEELIKQYIRQGLKEDLEKLDKHKHLVKERQLQIETMFNLLCGDPCPHCASELEIVETSIFSSWSGEMIAVCHNDDCSYFCNSWEVMKKQGHNSGYRFFRDANNSSGAIPVGPAERKSIKITLPKGFNKRKSCEMKKETEEGS